MCLCMRVRSCNRMAATGITLLITTMGATSSMKIMKGKVYVSTSTPVQDNRITEFATRAPGPQTDSEHEVYRQQPQTQADCTELQMDCLYHESFQDDARCQHCPKSAMQTCKMQ